jgi:phenylacetate-CoA ligase
VTLRKNAQALARERAVTARSYEWANIYLCDPEVRLWGIPLETETRLYYKLVDTITNRLRISAFNLSEQAMSGYLGRLQRFKPRYLYGYVSAVREFTRFVHDSGGKLPDSLKSIISTSEVLTPAIREEILRCTGINPHNEYGCGEVGSIAHECEERNMHIMADNLIIELLDDNGKPASSGEIVVTDLFNYATPLIRYRLKDFAEFSQQGCPCGRELPVLKKIHGRAYDFLITADGTRIHPELVMYLFESLKKRNAGVSQFQVVQKGEANFTINLVVAKDYKRGCESELKSSLEEMLGGTLQIDFCYLDTIEREKSGKIRLVKSEVVR